MRPSAPRRPGRLSLALLVLAVCFYALLIAASLSIQTDSAVTPLAYAVLPHSYRLHQKAVRAAWFGHSALTCFVAVLLLQHLVLCERSHRSLPGRHRYPGEVDDCVNTYD